MKEWNAVDCDGRPFEVLRKAKIEVTECAALGSNVRTFMKLTDPDQKRCVRVAYIRLCKVRVGKQNGSIFNEKSFCQS